MKNLIIISLMLGLFFGLISCKPTAQVAIAQPQTQPTTTAKTPTQNPAPKLDIDDSTKPMTVEELQAEARRQALQQRPKRQQKSYEPKVPGGKVNWMTFGEAEKASKKKPKKVFVEVYAPWCGWCKRLDQATFADKRVADYINENYYPVKFDAQHPDIVILGDKEYGNPDFDKSKPQKARNAIHQLAQKYGARSYPTILFLNEKMDLIKSIPGYRDADAFLPILEQFNQTTVPTQTRPAVKPDTGSNVKQLTEAQVARHQMSKRSYEPKVPGGKVNWMTFEEAEKAIANEPKKIFVNVHTLWTIWAERFDQATFADKRVADYINENYYPVKFDAQHPDIIILGGKEYANPDFDKSKPPKSRNGTHQLAKKYGARSYPTILFLNEKMDLIQSIPGYRDADAFLPILEQFNQTTVPAQTQRPAVKPDTDSPKPIRLKPANGAQREAPQQKQQRSDEPKVPGGKINWMTFEEAQAAMKNKPKKLFVDVYTHWCGPCKMLDRNTFSNPQLAEFINENYYPVKFNAQDENEIVFAGKIYSNPDYDPSKGQNRRNALNQLAVAMGVRAFPTMVILNEQLEILYSIKGYKDPQYLQPFLEQFAKM